MVFKYTAETQAGGKRRGTIEAESRTAAISQLMQQGLVPINVVDVKKDHAAKQESLLTRDFSFVDIHKRKVKKKKLLTFANQMGIMIRAGVPLTTAMDILTFEEEDRGLKKMLENIRMDLQLGIKLSASMKKYKAFPSIMISMVEAGEADGRLDNAFDRVASSMSKEMQLTSKVKSASIYPLFLLVLTIVMVIVISVFVLPNFVAIFENFDAELPGITKFMMNFSDFITSKWPWIVAVVALVVITFTLLKRHSEPFRLLTGKITLKIPAVGKLMRRVYAARFCDVLSAMSLAGIDITEGFKVTSNTIKNAHVRNSLIKIMDDIRIGSSISGAMEKNNPFDRLLLSMVRTGEESGMLPETLGKMSDMYEEQTNEQIKVLNGLLEPLMTVIIAGIVGTVVIAMVLPMFGIYNLL